MKRFILFFFLIVLISSVFSKEDTDVDKKEEKRTSIYCVSICEEKVCPGFDLLSCEDCVSVCEIMRGNGTNPSECPKVCEENFCNPDDVDGCHECEEACMAMRDLEQKTTVCEDLCHVVFSANATKCTKCLEKCAEMIVSDSAVDCDKVCRNGICNTTNNVFCTNCKTSCEEYKQSKKISKRKDSFQCKKACKTYLGTWDGAGKVLDEACRKECTTVDPAENADLLS